MSVVEIFTDAQESSINHKSLSKRLCKLEAKQPKLSEQIHEQVKQCALRVLEVPKSEKAGTNIVKFLCTYCATAQAIQTQRKEQDEQNGKMQEDDDDEPNITSELLLLLLPYMKAKDKVVRYRSTQIVSQLMGVIQEIEDEVYQSIRDALIKRIKDKVAAIRLEAVCALGRLLENEMEDELEASADKMDQDEEGSEDQEESMLPEEAGSKGLLTQLLDVLQNDTSTDVRKALLLHLPVEPKTLPYLLERARDKDAPTRRAFYTKLMPNLGDFRYLSLNMREKLLRWGLRDRDERVRKAAARMFSTLWIEQIAKSNIELDSEAERDDNKEKKKKDLGFLDPDTPALLELLERLDTQNAGADDGVGPDAMKEFWLLRPDYFKTVIFDDEFWQELSVEGAFMARTFYDHLATLSDEQRQDVEDQVPEVTRFGFFLQKYLNGIIHMRAQDQEGVEVDEQIYEEQQFICEQLLHIAHTLDYTDEMGRRKMFGLFRNMLAIPDLPEEITKLTIEALRLTCTADTAGEREFIAVVQEAITDIYDTLNDDAAQQADEDPDTQKDRESSPDESFTSAHSQVSDQTTKPASKPKILTAEEAEAQAERELLIQLKCLHIAHTLLQNIQPPSSTSQRHINQHQPQAMSHSQAIETLQATLIVPAVRSHSAPIREKAIECLGLCCLLNRPLAESNRDTFVYCLRKGHEDLRISCLKILCDITLTHSPKPVVPALVNAESNNTGTNPDGAEELDLHPFVKSLEYTPEIQQVAVTCVAKLIMCGFYAEPNIEAFDNAIEEAETMKARGWEVLSKVRAVVLAEREGKEVADH